MMVGYLFWMPIDVACVTVFEKAVARSLMLRPTMRSKDSPRPGPTPIIRASGSTIIYFLSIDDPDGRRQLLRIRCDADGDVVAAICAGWELCNDHGHP